MANEQENDNTSNSAAPSTEVANIVPSVETAGQVVKVGNEEFMIYPVPDIPKMILVQTNTANSAENEEKAEKLRAATGKFFMDIDESIYKEVIAIPIGVISERRYFKVNDDLLCYSLDMIRPAAKVEHPMADKCADCGKGKWADSDTGGRVLECQPVTTFAFINVTNPDLPEPVKMSFKSTGLREFNKFMRTLKAKVIQAYNRKQNMYNLAVKISTKLEKGQKGNYYIPQFELVQIENGEKYADMINTYKEHIKQYAALAVEEDMTSSEPPLEIEATATGVVPAEAVSIDDTEDIPF